MSRLHETRVMCVAPGPNEWNEYEAFVVQYHYASALADEGSVSEGDGGGEGVFASPSLLEADVGSRSSGGS
eukprot:289569-Rhodomonas_salina.1